MTRRTARLLAALAALTAATAGPPAVLLLLVGDPLQAPTALRSTAVLRHPLDDQSFLWLLAAVAWLLWLHLLGNVVVELLRQTRGSTVRMPLPGLLFGANNLLASHLVATLLLTLHPQASAAHVLTPAARPVAASPAMAAAARPAERPIPAGTAALPTVGAVRGADGKLTGTATAATVQCRVLPPRHRHHDTLWDIAERHLGDGTRWRDIFALNEGRLMPDGQRLTNASLIYPGWILRLPADARALPLDQVTPDRERASAPRAPGPGAPGTAPPPAPAGEHGARQQRPSAGPSAAAVPPAATVAPPTGARSEPDGAPQHHDTPHTAPDLDVAAAGLALAALGLLAALTRRRKLAARRRPPGTRPATPSLELTAAEAQLRREARAASDVAATVRLALLLAARHRHRTTVQVVWHHPDAGLELVLAEPSHDADAPPGAQVPFPFRPTDRGWLLPPDAQRYLFATQGRRPAPERIGEALQDAVDPFPLLVPVGTQTGSTCYVNLETFGLISLLPATPAAEATGGSRPDAVPLEVLGALVQALAGAPWAELTRVVVAPPLAGLIVGAAGIDVLDPQLLTELLADVDGTVPEHVRAAGSLDAARRTDPDAAGIIGTVIVAGLTPAQAPLRLLAAATRPTEPLAMLLIGPHPDAHPWQLHTDGTLTIPGVAHELRPLRLDPAHRPTLLRLLAHAQDPPPAGDQDPGLRARDADNPPPLPPGPAVSTATSPAGGAAVAAAQADATTVDRAVCERRPEPAEQPTDQHPRLPGPDARVGAPDQARGAPAGTDPDRCQDPVAPDDAPHVAADQGRVEIGVLGPVVVTGAEGSRPRGQVRELLVYLAVHRRPVASQRLWEAVFPDRPYNAHVLRSRMSDLRKHIRRQLLTEGQTWSLAPEVACDWQRFRALAAGPRDHQQAALALVRGRPFDGVDADWIHLEGQHAEVEAAIVDLALSVGQGALDDGDPAAAGAAASAGLRASPYDERLYRLAMTAAAERGATGQIRALRRQLERVLDEELEPDDTLQPSTEQLYRDLLDGDRPRRR